MQEKDVGREESTYKKHQVNRVGDRVLIKLNRITLVKRMSPLKKRHWIQPEMKNASRSQGDTKDYLNKEERLKY